VLFRGNRLRYRVSDPSGTTFTPAANLGAGEDFNAPKIASGANSRGFAVWHGTARAIRVVRLDPQPEPPDPPTEPLPTRSAPDRDRDGAPDATDNCPTDANRDQADEDRDAIGDACELLPPGNVRPRAGVSAVVELVSGDVRVRLPSSNRFVPLQGVASVPIGSTVDARKGVLALRSALNGFSPSSRRARRQAARIRAGMFKVRQRRARRNRRASIPTDLVLQSPARAEAACVRRRGPRKGIVRTLGVAVAKGHIRAVAGAGTATARRATFSVTDRCDGTLARVRKGRIAFKARGRRSSVAIRAGRVRLFQARLFRQRLP
jgi:hypothetical protein